MVGTYGSDCLYKVATSEIFHRVQGLDNIISHYDILQHDIVG